MAYQLGRFVYWINLAGNANLVLVAVTSVYVFLTYRILKWSTLAAREALQPKLEIHFGQAVGPITVKEFRITNVGEYSVVLLDIRVTCFENGRYAHHDMLPMDRLLVPKDESGGQIDFASDLSPHAVAMGTGFSYWVDVVVSDSRKRFVFTYRRGFYGTSLKRGAGVRVRFIRACRPLKTRYYRLKSWWISIINEVTKNS